MQASLKFLAAGTFGALVAFGGIAQAETYEGVQAPVSALSRADVQAEAVRTAAAPNQNVVRGSRGAEAFTPTADRAAVRQQAVRTAAAPDQNVPSGSRVDSKVISTMSNPADARTAGSPGGSRL